MFCVKVTTSNLISFNYLSNSNTISCSPTARDRCKICFYLFFLFNKSHTADTFLQTIFYQFYFCRKENKMLRLRSIRTPGCEKETNDFLDVCVVWHLLANKNTNLDRLFLKKSHKISKCYVNVVILWRWKYRFLTANLLQEVDTNHEWNRNMRMLIRNKTTTVWFWLKSFFSQRYTNGPNTMSNVPKPTTTSVFRVWHNL